MAIIQTTLLSIFLATITTTTTVVAQDSTTLTLPPGDTTPVPSDKAGIESWLSQSLAADPSNKLIAEAEKSPKVVKVRKDGSGEFKTITDAVEAIPDGNPQRVIIDIGPGEYNEKITVERIKPFVTFYGNPDNKPTIVYGGTAAKYGTVDSATVIIEAENFMAANIIFANSAPKPDGKKQGGQALALRISGDKGAFYNCNFTGYQDTLCDDKGRHFFKDCYIEGNVDFIFGNGRSLYMNCEINILGDNGYSFVVAHARQNPSETTGYSFVHCNIYGTGNGTYLGRAWMPAPSVVFAYTTMSKVILPEGWSYNFHPERAKTVFYGEFQNQGPGADPSKRAPFTKMLTQDQAKHYLTLEYISGSEWLRPAPKL